jgi:hypothetical protein
MSIKDLLEKGKPFYNLLLLLVIASIFFALGRLSTLVGQKTPIKIEYPNTTQTAAVVQVVSASTAISVPKSDVSAQAGEVIGSKTGKKYFFPWCGTVKLIKPENQVKFTSSEEARKAGYTPAANCKGLK